MKKRKPKLKKELPNAGIFAGKWMMHGERRCLVGHVQDGHALISYPNETVERASRIVRVADLHDLPVDA